MSQPHLTLLLLCLLAASCASDKDNSTEPHKGLSQRLSETGGYTVDSEGNWKPKSNKRSSFESEGASPYFKGQYDGNKTYKTGQYTKKTWWGNKDYGHKSYAGNTDGSRFQKNSRLDGKGAREAGTAAKVPDPYQTGTYATSAAREQSYNQQDKPSDAETDIRRGVYQQPEVIDWRQQRGLTLDQSKGILGR